MFVVESDRSVGHVTGEDEQYKTCWFFIVTDVCRIHCCCGGKWVECDGQKENVGMDYGHWICVSCSTLASLFLFWSFVFPTSMVGVRSSVSLDSVVVLPTKCHHVVARWEGGNASEQFE